jgi:PAS domain S-box-containing protein
MLWPATPAVAQPDRTRNVLVLHYYERALPANVTIDQSIRSILRPGRGTRIELFSEDYDVARFPAKGYEAYLHDTLRRKYRSRPIDLIITTLSPALDFMLRHRAGLFPGVPIVFCAVDERELARYTLGSSVTGVTIKGDFVGRTLAVALGLHPEAREVIYVGGTTAFEKAWEAEFTQTSRAYTGRVKFRSLSHFPMNQILEEVAHLPPSAIVFYFALSRDSAGNAFTPRDALGLVAQASSVPVYGISDTYVGHGAVGGHMVSFEAQGTRAARVALRLLRGEKVANIPVVRDVPNVTMFDWRQLRRWRIPEDRLPPGSVIWFREPSVWELYKWYILGGVSLLALQSLLIGTLLVERRQRRHAQRSLNERLRFQTLVSSLSAAFVNLPAARVDEEIERGLIRIVEFLGVDRAELAQFSMETGVFLITHAATNEGIEGPPSVVKTAELPWITDRLVRGEIVRFSRLADLPVEASVDREGCLRRGVKAQVLIPMAVGGTTLGALAYTMVRAERAWPDALMPQLLLVGEVFANALVRKRGQEALRQSEDRFRLLSETTRAVPWEADAKTGQFTYVGPQAERLLGYPVAEWYKKEFWPDHIHPEERESTVNLCLKLTQTHKDYEFEYRMLTADGGIVWVHDIVSVESADSEPKTLRGFLIDISDRKRAEEDLQRHREQLVHVTRVTTMGELTASLAHELNQPLTAIVSNAQAGERFLAAPSPPLAEVREILEDIVADGQRAGEVIRRLRGLLKNGEFEFAHLDLNGVIGEVVTLAGADALVRNIPLALELDSNLPPVRGDRVQLQQVLLNLILNGLEAMGDGVGGDRKLLIRTDLGVGGTVRVAVRDSGVGILENTLDRIFEPFYSTKPTGMGMGLSITRSIVEAHGGRIWAANNPDHGATIWFTLPASL